MELTVYETALASIALRKYLESDAGQQEPESTKIELEDLIRKLDDELEAIGSE